MIRSIRICHFGKPASARRRYQIGDTRVIRGQVHVKQQMMAYERGRPIGYLVWGGRPRTEWVLKDGPHDRNSVNFIPPTNL